MADYYSQCVVSPMLPLGDITAAEQLILRNVFDSEVNGEELYLFAEIGRHSSVHLERPDMLGALSATAFESVATALLVKAVEGMPAGETIAKIEIDEKWIDIMHEVLIRSETLKFVTVETSFTCSKMRPDGFGGAAMVITPQTVDQMSTSQFIREALTRRLGSPATSAQHDGGQSDA